MNIFNHRLKLRGILCLLLLKFGITPVFSQTGVLDPNDPIVVYNPSSPPVTPAYGTLAKWVKTNRLNWNTSSYKCYFYKGVAFRLKFPKTYQHNIADGKTYPIFVFFHGVGEKGSIYDNEFQLYHGGQLHRDAVDNGAFDGYLLYIQSSAASGAFADAYYTIVSEIIQNYLVPQVKGDINRVYVDGLSGGGSATWDFTIKYPKLVAACLPISASSLSFQSSANSLKFTPIWHFQGALDNNPNPETSHTLGNTFLAAGAQYRYTEYPNQGHGCWYSAWGEADYFPFMNRAHKANPWPLGGRSEFCPGDPVTGTLGVTAGFDGYEWKKDGVVIAGATTNQYTFNALGTYECRIKRGTVWSPWSPNPIVIKIKSTTVPPPIQVAGLMSKVIPALDGNNGVTLSEPAGYTSYDWRKVGSNTTLSTTKTLNATTPGDYIVRVTEQFGCASVFSSPFTVIDANGPNKPDAAINLSVTTLSKTSLRLDWSDNPSPTYNETNFEVYQASQAGGPYTLVGITGADVLSFNVVGLSASTKYYYKVRAVNNSGAAPASNEANGTTAADNQPPTAPTNLSIGATTRSSVSLTWVASNDDVGVAKYDVYVNGIKSYVTTETQFTVFNLEKGQSYNFAVKARDFANNASPFSNQVTGQPLLNGLAYKYYTFTGTWNNLPDFNTLTPVATGVMPNVALVPRTQDDNFAFLWEGYLNVTVAGTYNFRTNSDDGSKLYLGPLNGTASPYSYGATAIVNNDGLHGTQNATSANINLSVGVYPIAITFYEQGGGEAMTVSWRRGSASYAAIPNSAFADVAVNNGSAPAAPSALTATAISYKRIDLNWTDNSNNESGFEIWRSTSVSGGYATIGLAPANATNYVDSTLDANTTYYYKIRAIGQYGESDLVPAGDGGYSDAQAHWRFNNNYNDASGNGKTLTANNSPTFSTDAQEPTHSVDMNGSNEDITVNTSSGDYLRGGYSEKSVVFWMKADNTSNRGIFDFGGSDDGLAMRLNSGILYAGIASNNTRKSISTPYTSTGWNHIALVYSTNKLYLYVNGALVASNTSLGFNSVGTTSDGSMIGDDNNANALNTSFGQFDGRMDNFAIFGRALTVDEINAIRNNTYGLAMATTFSLPVVPAAPTTFVASGISTSAVNVSWTDNVNNEDKYELYRSSNNNSNYVLLATLPANTTTYKDSSLFANAIYYYKVRAANIGGASAFAVEDSAKTGNNIPVLAAIDNQYMRYGTQLQLNLQATDLDPEVLTLTPANLPAFATFTPTGNGAATLSFNPSQSTDQGTYNNLSITVTDQHGGSKVVTFNLVVNNNYNPHITTISNVTVNETQTAQLNLAATDQNAGDVLTWSFTGLPSFVSVTTGTGTAQLNLAPGYANGGTYVVKARVEDGNFGFDTASFVITVVDVNPNRKVYINFNSGANAGTGVWNNTNKIPAQNDNFANLKDATGANSGMSLTILSAWQGVGNGTNELGVNTGNNSGVYPDPVMASAYWSNTTQQSIRISGLDVNSKYNFTFFGSRANVTDDRTSTYTINGQTVSLNAANNRQNTVSLLNLQPAADGTLVLYLKNAATSSFSYLNAMVIELLYDDHTAPAKPRNLAAVASSGKVDLSWIDASYNEDAYEVYRSTAYAGPYTLLNPGGNKDIQQYTDNTVSGNKTYYYVVRAINGYGNSAADTVSVVTPNGAPVLAALADLNMKNDDVLNVNVTATDDPGDIITLQASNLPAFASFTDNGNGTGVIHLAPTNANFGSYQNVTITARDDKNASSAKSFNITVTDKNLTSIYVNFNNTTLVGPTPWNNFNTVPLAGRNITNLKDEINQSTGISISLVDNFEGVNELGASTGNNSGVYPDDVMKSSYYESTTTAKRIRITGLPAGKKYNLIFFGSRGGVSDNRTTVYAVGAKTASLNAASNTSVTAPINGLSPDAQGTIEFTVTKGSGASFAYLNAMVIQSYVDNGLPLSPANLQAVPKSKTTIQLNWADKTDNETGFQIFRSTSVNGTYTQIATVGANVTSYTNQSLSANTSYYYKVRAAVGTVYSEYSNIAAASTFSYSVSVNFNRDNPQATPWNNTNNVPQVGSVYSNLINDQSNPTGIDMTVVDGFSGENPFGMNTGNNSGVVPDNVMRSSWWLDFNVTGQVRFSGLSQAMSYSFVFFGSRDGSGNKETVYTIGNKSVTLNCTYNTQNTVQIDNVKPDENGEVLVTVSLSPNASFGYLGAIIIQAYKTITDLPGTGGGGTTTNSTTGVETVVTPTQLLAADNQTQIDLTAQSLQNTPLLQVYPNPVKDMLTLTTTFDQAQADLSVRIIDMNGRLVYIQQYKNVPQGRWTERLNIGNRLTQPGIYILQLYGSSIIKPFTLRIVKGK